MRLFGTVPHKQQLRCMADKTIWLLSEGFEWDIVSFLSSWCFNLTTNSQFSMTASLCNNWLKQFDRACTVLFWWRACHSAWSSTSGDCMKMKWGWTLNSRFWWSWVVVIVSATAGWTFNKRWFCFLWSIPFPSSISYGSLLFKLEEQNTLVLFIGLPHCK